MTSSRSVAGTTITLLRTPLLLTDQLAQRLGVEAKVRPVVKQGLAALDALAEKLAPAQSASGGSAPASGATEPEPSTEPERLVEAEPEVAEVPVDVPAAPVEAADDKEDLIEHLAEEQLEAEEDAPLAGELAEDAELRRVQAELNAKRLVAEQEEQHRPE